MVFVLSPTAKKHLLICSLVILLFSSSSCCEEQSSGNGFIEVNNWHSWTTHGKNLENNRYSPHGLIKPSTFDLTTPDWIFDIGNVSGVFATPMVLGNRVYFPDGNGELYCLDIPSKRIIWQKNIGFHYYNTSTHTNKYKSRTTPVPYRYKNTTYILVGVLGPADILLINAASGSLQQKVTLDQHVYAIITQSGQVYDNHFFVGTSSMEELYARDNNFACCTFRGGFYKIKLPTLTVEGTPFYTIPAEINGVGKFSGNAIWGSSPAIDRETGIVYIATGNNYRVPADYSACITNTPPENRESVCNSVGLRDKNYFESVIGLRISDLSLVFGKRLSDYDAWVLACGGILGTPRGVNCPTNPGEDYDFGMAPTLGWIPKEGKNGERRRVLFVGQKSGELFALDASNGEIIWSVMIGPGGKLGGLLWGIAADETMIYVSFYNSEFLPWTLKNGTTVPCGGWVKVRQSDGNVEWTTVNPACFDPSGPTGSPNSNGRSTTAHAAGPPIVIGNVVLVTSTDTTYYPTLASRNPVSGHGGFVYALKASDGSIFSSHETGSSVYGGFSSDGVCAFVGTGYSSSIGLSEGHYLFKWCASMFQSN